MNKHIPGLRLADSLWPVCTQHTTYNIQHTTQQYSVDLIWNICFILFVRSFNYYNYCRHYLCNLYMPSVLWRCWLGGRKGIRPVKNMGDGGGRHWLVQMEWRPVGWSVYLPLLIFPCTIKCRSSLLAPAHPCSPGKRAVKRLWWWWLYMINFSCFIVPIQPLAAKCQ